MELITYAIIAAVAVFTLIVLWSACAVTTPQNARRVIERFGKFVKVADSGLTWKKPFIESKSKVISLRTQPLDFTEGSYTDKGTSVTIGGQVQFKIGENPGDVNNAYYKLSNPEAQIRSHVASAIRGKVPTMSLEQIQNQQKVIGDAIKSELAATMQQYGYIIEDVNITKADPDAVVVNANNEKYASEQAKITAQNTAEANYTRVTREADAQRDASKSRGEGVALELEAITNGRQKSLETLRKSCPKASDHELLAFASLTQYIDGQVKIASTATAGTKVIFTNNAADAAQSTLAALTQSFVAGAEASKGPEESAQTEPATQS